MGSSPCCGQRGEEACLSPREYLFKRKSHTGMYYKGDLHMKSLLAVITLVLGLVFMQARAFAALPKAKPENPNVAAGREAIEAKDFKSAVGNLTKAVQENPKDADRKSTRLNSSHRTI